MLLPPAGCLSHRSVDAAGFGSVLHVVGSIGNAVEVQFESVRPLGTWRPDPDVEYVPDLLLACPGWSRSIKARYGRAWSTDGVTFRVFGRYSAQAPRDVGGLSGSITDYRGVVLRLELDGASDAGAANSGPHEPGE